MFISLQNCLNFSERKLPPAPDIIFLDNPNSEKKIILNASIKLSVNMPSIFFDCWKPDMISLTYKGNFCYIEKPYLCQQLSIVCLVFPA